MSVVGVALPLLGYGVALAVESELRIPHAMLIGSPTDFLELAIYAVAYLMEGMTRLESSWQAIILGTNTIALYRTVVVAVWFVLTTRWFLHSRHSRHKAYGPLRQRAESVIDPARWGALRWPQPMLRTLGVSLGVGVFAIAAQAIALASLWFAICLVLIGLALFPTVGFGAGRKYLEDYVVTPSRCAPVEGRVSRISSVDPESRGGATCVAICKDEKLLGYGRVALSTSRATVLFDPDTGDASRVSTDGTTVRTVPAIDVPEVLRSQCKR